jgi:glutathione-independent formaldehyde dehydrogenase
MEKIRDLTCLSDILTTDSTEPSPPMSASDRWSMSPAQDRSASLLQRPRASLARQPLIGDMNQERLAHAKNVGFEPIDLTKHDRLGELVGPPRRSRSRLRDRLRPLRS